jgi:hypothetical protein
VIFAWNLPASDPANRTSHPPPGAAVTTAFPLPIDDSPVRADWTVEAEAL